MAEAKQVELRGARAHDRLTAEFVAAGINPTEFGFYDQAAFQAHEERDPAYLERYAEWVISRPVDAGYEAHVRATVPKLASLVARALVADAMQGACITAYGMMTRMLDRLGVWSFGLYGSVNLDVPHLGLRQSFHATDRKTGPNSATGHAWVCAPPYLVVDPSLALQEWDDARMAELVPPAIVADATAATVIDPTVEDCVSEGLRNFHGRRDGEFDFQLHHRLEPRLAAFAPRFSAHEVALDELIVRFVPVAIRQSTLPLERMNLETGWGRPAITIWNDEIAPAFDL